MLDPLDVLLMEGNLLQGKDLPIIVFCSAADQILTDWSESERERISLPTAKPQKHIGLCGKNYHKYKEANIE